LPGVVLTSVGHIRPTVVLARANDVDLVATLRPVIDLPEFAGLRMKRRAFRILESVREGFGQYCRAAQPGIVFRNRAITVDANDAAGEVAAYIRVVRERVFNAVEIGVVEAKAVGAADQQRSVAGDDDATLDAFGEDVNVFKTRTVLAQTSASHTLRSELHCPAFGERLGPDALVEELDGPRRRRLTLRRSEVREVQRPIFREVGIEDDVVQTLRGDGLHSRHPCQRCGDHTVRPDDPHGSGVLRHKQIAVWQERDRPRAGESTGDGLRVELRRWLRWPRCISLSGECWLRFWRLSVERDQHSCAHRRDDAE
jgi:hypothetical protein